MNRGMTAWKDINGWFHQSDADFVDSLCRGRNWSGGVAVELGVWKGRSTVAIAPACRVAGCARYYAVDDFKGGRASNQRIKNHYARIGPDEAEEQFKNNIIDYGLNDFVFLHVGDSAEAADKIGSHDIRFVFVDASHDLVSVTDDIAAWWPRIQPGGIMAGHDYYDRTDGEGGEVRQAVHAFFDHRSLEIVRGEHCCWAVRKP